MLPSNVPRKECYIAVDAGQAVLFDDKRIERLRFDGVENVGDGAARGIARIRGGSGWDWDISYEMNADAGGLHRIISIDPGACAEPTISYEEVNDG